MGATAKTKGTQSPDFVSGFVEAISAGVAERVSEMLSRQSAYVNQFTAPISRIAFVRATRKGEFPSYKIGETIVAKRADFDAWLERHKRVVRKPAPAPAPSSEPENDDEREDDEMRRALGLEPKPKTKKPASKKGRAA